MFLFLKKLFSGRGNTDVPELVSEKRTYENPYLWQLREILEQILEKKQISYGNFIPIIIDGSQMERLIEVIEPLCKDLNRLIIFTDRAVYFEEFTEIMFEEQGLLVEIFPKSMEKIEWLASKDMSGNVILDFEAPKERNTDIKFGEKLYIPIFKKMWESGGNLDITVPIGYNTVIVGIGKAEQEYPGLDKFERAFFADEGN